MDEDQEKTWERLKKPFLTLEQKKEIIRKANMVRHNEDFKKILDDLKRRAEEK